MGEPRHGNTKKHARHKLLLTPEKEDPSQVKMLRDQSSVARWLYGVESWIAFLKITDEDHSHSSMRKRRKVLLKFSGGRLL